MTYCQFILNDFIRRNQLSVAVRHFYHSTPLVYLTELGCCFTELNCIVSDLNVITAARSENAADCSKIVACGWLGVLPLELA